MAETSVRRSLQGKAGGRGKSFGGFNSAPARSVQRTRSASPSGKIVTSRPLHSV